MVVGRGGLGPRGLDVGLPIPFENRCPSFALQDAQAAATRPDVRTAIYAALKGSSRSTAVASGDLGMQVKGVNKHFGSALLSNILALLPGVIGGTPYGVSGKGTRKYYWLEPGFQPDVEGTSLNAQSSRRSGAKPATGGGKDAVDDVDDDAYSEDDYDEEESEDGDGADAGDNNADGAVATGGDDPGASKVTSDGVQTSTVARAAAAHPEVRALLLRAVKDGLETGVAWVSEVFIGTKYARELKRVRPLLRGQQLPRVMAAMPELEGRLMTCWHWRLRMAPVPAPATKPVAAAAAPMARPQSAPASSSSATNSGLGASAIATSTCPLSVSAEMRRIVTQPELLKVVLDSIRADKNEWCPQATVAYAVHNAGVKGLLDGKGFTPVLAAMAEVSGLFEARRVGMVFQYRMRPGTGSGPSSAAATPSVPFSSPAAAGSSSGGGASGAGISPPLPVVDRVHPDVVTSARQILRTASYLGGEGWVTLGAIDALLTDQGVRSLCGSEPLVAVLARIPFIEVGSSATGELQFKLRPGAAAAAAATPSPAPSSATPAAGSGTSAGVSPATGVAAASSSTTGVGAAVAPPHAHASSKRSATPTTLGSAVAAAAAKSAAAAAAAAASTAATKPGASAAVTSSTVIGGITSSSPAVGVSTPYHPDFVHATYAALKQHGDNNDTTAGRAWMDLALLRAEIRPVLSLLPPEVAKTPWRAIKSLPGVQSRRGDTQQFQYRLVSGFVVPPKSAIKQASLVAIVAADGEGSAHATGAAAAADAADKTDGAPAGKTTAVVTSPPATGAALSASELRQMAADATLAVLRRLKPGKRINAARLGLEVRQELKARGQSVHFPSIDGHRQVPKASTLLQAGLLPGVNLSKAGAYGINLGAASSTDASTSAASSVGDSKDASTSAASSVGASKPAAFVRPSAVAAAPSSSSSAAIDDEDDEDDGGLDNYDDGNDAASSDADDDNDQDDTGELDGGMFLSTEAPPGYYSWHDLGDVSEPGAGGTYSYAEYEAEYQRGGADVSGSGPLTARSTSSAGGATGASAPAHTDDAAMQTAITDVLGRRTAAGYWTPSDVLFSHLSAQGYRRSVINDDVMRMLSSLPGVFNDGGARVRRYGYTSPPAGAASVSAVDGARRGALPPQMHVGTVLRPLPPGPEFEAAVLDTLAILPRGSWAVPSQVRLELGNRGYATSVADVVSALDRMPGVLKKPGPGHSLPGQQGQHHQQYFYQLKQQPSSAADASSSAAPASPPRAPVASTVVAASKSPGASSVLSADAADFTPHSSSSLAASDASSAGAVQGPSTAAIDVPVTGVGAVVAPVSARTPPPPTPAPTLSAPVTSALQLAVYARAVIQHRSLHGYWTTLSGLVRYSNHWCDGSNEADAKPAVAQVPPGGADVGAIVTVLTSLRDPMLTSVRFGPEMAGLDGEDGIRCAAEPCVEPPRQAMPMMSQPEVLAAVTQVLRLQPRGLALTPLQVQQELLCKGAVVAPGTVAATLHFMAVAPPVPELAAGTVPASFSTDVSTGTQLAYYLLSNMSMAGQASNGVVIEALPRPLPFPASAPAVAAASTAGGAAAPPGAIQLLSPAAADFSPAPAQLSPPALIPPAAVPFSTSVGGISSTHAASAALSNAAAASLSSILSSAPYGSSSSGAAVGITPSAHPSAVATGAGVGVSSYAPHPAVSPAVDVTAAAAGVPASSSNSTTTIVLPPFVPQITRTFSSAASSSSGALGRSGNISGNVGSVPAAAAGFAPQSANAAAASSFTFAPALSSMPSSASIASAPPVLTAGSGGAAPAPAYATATTIAGGGSGAMPFPSDDTADATAAGAGASGDIDVPDDDELLGMLLEADKG